MGFFQGVAKAVGEISEENFARREKQKDRDLQIQRDEEGRKHDFALLQEQFKMKQKETLLSLVKSRKPSSSSSESGSTNSDVEANAAYLVNSGYSKEFVSRVMASDPSALSDLVDQTKKVQVKFAQLDQTPGPEYFKSVEDNAVIVDRTSVNINDKAFLEQFGLLPEDVADLDIDELEYSVPGSVVTPDLVEPGDPLTISELNAVEERAFKETRMIAQDKLVKMSKLINMDASDQGSLPDETKEILLDLYTETTEALESAKGENANLVPLVNLYGVSGVEAIKNKHKNLNPAQLSSIFTRPTSPKVLTFSSQEEAKRVLGPIKDILPPNTFIEIAEQ